MTRCAVSSFKRRAVLIPVSGHRISFQKERETMRIKYLGTAAAEGIPALYCQCPLCTEAGKLKGKDIRGRSGLLVDGRLMIDFPPDMLWNAVRYDLDLAKVANLIVTHSHTDHFAPADMVLRLPGCYCRFTDGEPVLHVYGNGEVLRLTENALLTEYGKRSVDFLDTHLLCAFQTERIGGYDVTPLPAVHKPDEEAFFYLVQREGLALLYAHDTGIFPESVFSYLRDGGILIDILSMDCTCCLQSDGKNHMGLPDNLAVLRRLRENYNVNDETRCIVSHFSHNGGLTHTQLEREAAKYGLTAAYDGMEVELPYELEASPNSRSQRK